MCLSRSIYGISLLLTICMSTVSVGQTQQEAYNALISAMEDTENYDLIHPQVVEIENECIETLTWIIEKVQLLVDYPNDQQTYSSAATTAESSLASSIAALDTVEDLYWQGTEYLVLGWNSYSVEDYANAVSCAGEASSYFSNAELLIAGAANVLDTNRALLDTIKINLMACLDSYNIFY
jgi:hypothetical protein